jgi:hypothetical protein
LTRRLYERSTKMRARAGRGDGETKKSFTTVKESGTGSGRSRVAQIQRAAPVERWRRSARARTRSKTSSLPKTSAPVQTKTANTERVKAGR